jgi:HSP20 family protein
MNYQTNSQTNNQAEAGQVAASQAAGSQVEQASCCGGSACKSQPRETHQSAAQAPARPGRTFVPAVDTFEQGDELVMVFDVPGAKADEIDVRYDDGELRIHAPIAPRNSGRNFLLQEFEVGHYARAFGIGNMFDPSRIEADFANGVLTLRLPKHEATKPRKINVKANA